MDKETKSSGKNDAKITEDSFGNNRTKKIFSNIEFPFKTKRKFCESVSEPTRKRQLSKESITTVNGVVSSTNGANAVPPSDGELFLAQMPSQMKSDPTKNPTRAEEESSFVPGSNMELDKSKGNNTSVNTFHNNNIPPQSIDEFLDDVELAESGDQDQNSQDDMEGSQLHDQSTDNSAWLNETPDMEIDLKSSTSFIHKRPCTANDIPKPTQSETLRTSLLSSQEIFDEPTSPAISQHDANDVHNTSPSTLSHVMIGGMEACIIEMQENQIDEQEQFAEANVMQWMSKREQNYQPKAHYLSWQPQMSANMRAVLLDWMAEVCEEYRVHRETYHISVNYVDRFLTKFHSLPRDKLQLLGIVALFVASKFEETYAMQPKELANVTAETYTVDQILRTENILVTTLQWKLLPPTSYSWLRMYICKRLQTYSEDTRDKFPKTEFLKMITLIDYAILDPTSMEFSASLMAASAFHAYYANDASVTQSVTGYDVAKLEKCIDFLKGFERFPLPKQVKMPPEYWELEYHEYQLKVDGVLEQVKDKIRLYSV